MPRIFRAIGDELNHRFSRKDNTPVNEFVGFQPNCAAVFRDRRHVQSRNPQHTGRFEANVRMTRAKFSSPRKIVEATLRSQALD